MGDRPIGVTVAAVLTLLGAIGDFFFAIVLLALFSVGGPPPSGYRPSPLISILVYSPILLSLASFIVSWGILNGGRQAWYSSIILWIFSTLYYAFLAMFLFRGINSVLMAVTLGLTMITSVGLIAYFQTKRVKNYFWISRAEESKRCERTS